MKKFAFALLLISFAAASTAFAVDPPQPPPVEKEHKWLAQLAGEWETAAEAMIEPGKPPMKCTGTENARMIGNHWIVSEINNKEFGMTGIMTVGYDPAKKKFIGTWVDSMSNHMWKYEGSLDETGKILTLEAEGPNMAEPGKMAKYRDVTEVKSKDHKVLTSSILMDGKWVQFMTMDAKRKASK